VDRDEQLARELVREQLSVLRSKGRRERHELVTRGFDDFLALMGPAPSISGIVNTPTSLGVKIPTLPSSSIAGAPYVVLAGACDLDKGERLVGFAQWLSIAAFFGSGDAGNMPPFYYRERPVVTPSHRFQDVPPPTWLVHIQAKSPGRTNVGPLDQASFAQSDSDTASMLYKTATIPVLPLAPGYLGLTAYVPPALIGTPWYACNSLHYPFNQSDFFALRYVAPGTVRVRVYVLVWQTNPASRTDTVPGLSASQDEYASESFAPEDAFVQALPNKVQYRSAGCRLIVDKFTRRELRA
jgi:hypothetical protein